jgi:hypothetical protein
LSGNDKLRIAPHIGLFSIKIRDVFRKVAQFGHTGAEAGQRFPARLR